MKAIFAGMKNELSPGAILAKQKFKNKRKPFGKKAVLAAAAALGRMGGQVGGPARAAALSTDRLADIALHAANARWANKCTCSQCRTK